MKPRYVILLLLASSTLLFASLVIPCDKSKPPAVSLPDAYQQAMIGLGTRTNQYHCISATIPDVVPPVVTPPAWLFTFYSTNTPPKKWMAYVEMNVKHEVYIAR
jgi:hypothetical protein